MGIISTGNSFGAHLHFGMKHFPDGKEGWPWNLIDPTPFIQPLLGGTPPPDRTDLLPYLAGVTQGFGPLYELQIKNGPQERVQSQWAGGKFYTVKGQNWEERWVTGDRIWFGTDTSEGPGLYYTQRTGTVYGHPWVARYMREGESFYREPTVTHYEEANNCRARFADTVGSWMKLVKIHQNYRFQDSGITLPNVVELVWSWAQDGARLESYLYASGYGLVGWSSHDGRYSYVSEIHSPGDRPDNVRKVIGCLGGS
jgi:hypothetical protein